MSGPIASTVPIPNLVEIDASKKDQTESIEEAMLGLQLFDRRDENETAVDYEDDSVISVFGLKDEVHKLPLRRILRTQAVDRYLEQRKLAPQQQTHRRRPLMICKDYQSGNSTSCRYGALCGFVHFNGDQSETVIIHRNKEVIQLSEVPYLRLPAGREIIVLDSQWGEYHCFDSGLLLVTEGSQRAFDSATEPQTAGLHGSRSQVPVQHCTHYQKDHCERGALCRFIHPAFLVGLNYPQSLLSRRLRPFPVSSTAPGEPSRVPSPFVVPLGRSAPHPHKAFGERRDQQQQQAPPQNQQPIQPPATQPQVPGYYPIVGMPSQPMLVPQAPPFSMAMPSAVQPVPVLPPGATMTMLYPYPTQQAGLPPTAIHAGQPISQVSFPQINHFSAQPNLR